MTIYVPIWKHIRDALPTIEDAVISKLREMFTTGNPDVSVKKPGKWVIALADLHRVDDFIKDESNLKVAEAHVAGLMMGAGSARARGSRFSVKISIAGENLFLHSEKEIQDFLDGIIQIHMRQDEELADLREKVSRLGKPEVVVSNSAPQKIARYGTWTVSKKNESRIEALAQAIADHPETFFGVKSQAEILKRIIDLAASLGLKTSMNKPWKMKNLRNYTKFLEHRVSEIIKEKIAKNGKPRVRARAGM